MYPNMNSNILRSSINLIKSIDFPALLDGTSKTLGVINQAIPVYNQIKPIISNLNTINKINKAINEPIEKNNNSPIFYI